MHHHQKEYQQAPLRNDGVPVDPRVHQGEVYNQTGQYPQEVGRQPGQVYGDAMPPHNFVGNAGRDQVYAQDPQSGYGNTNVGNDIDSYGTASATGAHPFTGTHHHHHGHGHHHGQQDEAVQAGATSTGTGSAAPTTSYVDPSAHRAAVPPPPGSGTAGATSTTGAAQGTGGVEPTTGEKIRGTLRQTMGELQGNPRKAAEGKALKEGTHPVQTGPYSNYTAGGGPRHI